MSSLDTGSGQEVVSPATEGRDNDVDNSDCGSSTTSSSSSSSTSSERSRVAEEQLSTLVHLYVKMVHLFKEVSLMLLVCAAYAALSHDPPKIIKSPPAFPFFPDGSPVKDWYRGNINSAIGDLVGSDVSFVMFYAPWDAESQEVRSEFETAALHMHKLVTFNAVNCWQPGSECRIKFSKAYSWPVLIAYTANGRVIQYNGPKNAFQMIKFLYKVITPYRRINSTAEIYEIEVYHDAVVVACVDTNPGSSHFGAVYSAALKFLERDPFGDVAFLVLPKSDHQIPYLTLHLWNETLMYPIKDILRTETILNWLSKRVHQVTMWIDFAGSKSQQLASYMGQGPSILLFTPQNPFLDIVDYYNMLKLVAMEYYNCDGNKRVTTKITIANLVRQDRRLNAAHARSKAREELVNTISYSPAALWLNNTCCVSDALDSELIERCAKNGEACLKIYPKQLNLAHQVQEKHCEDEFRYTTSMLTGDNDLRSPRHLLKTWKRSQMKYKELAESFGPSTQTEFDFGGFNVTGMSCRTNISLSLLAVDSIKYHLFAEQFGVNVLKQKNKTVLLLLNEKAEVHHVFDGYLTDRSIREFIANFTEKNLPRALYSSSDKFRYSHFYPNRKDCSSRRICVAELDANNFLPTIMEEDKMVIVLYHSKQCSFCNGISYTFLKVAKVLSPVASHVRFGRIDGDLNTLPWEYVMETYPTILLFPARRKSESRAFPQDLPVTVANLISFILTNLEPRVKLNLMWSICNQTKHIEDKKVCLASLRAENIALIGQTLKEWRLADPHSRRGILRKLQRLRQLHLHLALAPGNKQLVESQLRSLERARYTYLKKVTSDKIEELL